MIRVTSGKKLVYVDPSVLVQHYLVAYTDITKGYSLWLANDVATLE